MTDNNKWITIKSDKDKKSDNDKKPTWITKKPTWITKKSDKDKNKDKNWITKKSDELRPSNDKKFIGDLDVDYLP